MFAAAAVALAAFLIFFLTRPAGPGGFFPGRALVAAACAASAGFALLLFFLAGRISRTIFELERPASVLLILFTVNCFVWSFVFFFAAVFDGLPFLNGDPALVAAVVTAFLGFRMLGLVDRSRDGGRIRLRHKIVFSLVVAFAAAEILLRIFAGSIFPDSPEMLLRGHFRHTFFVEEEERLRHEKWAHRRLENRAPGRLRHPQVGFILNPEAFPDYPIVFDPLRHSGLAPAGKTRVVCLGGSAAFRGFPRFLGPALKKYYPAKDFEVIDAAVPGYTGYTSYLNFSSRVSASRPDVVVIYHGINELKYLFSPDLREDYSHLGLPWVEKKDERGVYALCRKLAVVRFLNLAAMRILARPQARRKWEPELSKEARETAKGHMRKLLSAVREAGGRPVLCTFALARGGEYPQEISEKIDGLLHGYAPGVSAENAAQAIADLNKDRRKLAKETGTPLLDLEKLMPRKAVYFIDCCHHSDKGAMLISDMIAQFIHQKGIR